jgi:hypothetical protein
MHVNLLIATILFALMYVFASAGFVNQDLATALAWTASILTVVAFLRTKPLDKLK